MSFSSPKVSTGSTPRAAWRDASLTLGNHCPLVVQTGLLFRLWAGVVPDQRRKAWVNALGSA
jgi:hypothetical protein